MDHPAVSEVVQQCFHLPRNVEHIRRCTENEQFGLLHSGKNRGKRGRAAAFLLLSPDAGIAPHTDMGHILWKLKFKEPPVVQKLTDQQPGEIVCTGLRPSASGINDGDIHTLPPLFAPVFTGAFL